eukprot:1286249-Amphidinium_carterae.1
MASNKSNPFVSLCYSAGVSSCKPRHLLHCCLLFGTLSPLWNLLPDDQIACVAMTPQHSWWLAAEQLLHSSTVSRTTREARHAKAWIAALDFARTTVVEWSHG